MNSILATTLAAPLLLQQGLPGLTLALETVEKLNTDHFNSHRFPIRQPRGSGSLSSDGRRQFSAYGSRVYVVELPSGYAWNARVAQMFAPELGPLFTEMQTPPPHEDTSFAQVMVRDVLRSPSRGTLQVISELRTPLRPGDHLGSLLYRATVSTVSMLPQSYGENRLDLVFGAEWRAYSGVADLGSPGALIWLRHRDGSLGKWVVWDGARLKNLDLPDDFWPLMYDSDRDLSVVHSGRSGESLPRLHMLSLKDKSLKEIPPPHDAAYGTVSASSITPLSDGRILIGWHTMVKGALGEARVARHESDGTTFEYGLFALDVESGRWSYVGPYRVAAAAWDGRALVLLNDDGGGGWVVTLP